MSEPIVVDCEGSGCPPCASLLPDLGMCSMCGSVHTVVGGVVLQHRRVDIIAMIQRGDFD